MEILKGAQNTMHRAHSATYSSLGATHHRPVQRPPLRADFLKLVSGYYVYLRMCGGGEHGKKEASSLIGYMPD